MITINKGQSNNIVVTLRENSTVSNPIYLFMFRNQQTQVNYYFISTDISNFKDRFNKFLLVEKTNPNTLSGEVELGNEGFYDYEIYQTNLSSTSGLTNASQAIPNIVKTVEYGLVWVTLESEVLDIYNPQTTTTIAYQPS